MSKKKPSTQKSAFDIPPVPQETRYINSQPLKSSYLDGWIPDLINSDFEEMPLPPETQATSRFFKNDQKRQAIHLLDSLYIPGANRVSATDLTVLKEGVYFTIHLAIASPATLKLGVQSLRQVGPYETANDTSKLLSNLIRLQSPHNILDAFQYEQFFMQELMEGDHWGRALFTSLLWECRPPIELLTDWQRERLLPNTPDGSDKGAALLFTGLFASRLLKNSYPNLAAFSERVIGAGLQTPVKDRMNWAIRTLQEWIPMHLNETDTTYARADGEVIKAAEWLVLLIERIAAASQPAGAAA